MEPPEIMAGRDVGRRGAVVNADPPERCLGAPIDGGGGSILRNRLPDDDFGVYDSYSNRSMLIFSRNNCNNISHRLHESSTGNCSDAKPHERLIHRCGYLKKNASLLAIVATIAFVGGADFFQGGWSVRGGTGDAADAAHRELTNGQQLQGDGGYDRSPRQQMLRREQLLLQNEMETAIVAARGSAQRIAGLEARQLASVDGGDLPEIKPKIPGALGEGDQPSPEQQMLRQEQLLLQNELQTAIIEAQQKALGIAKLEAQLDAIRATGDEAAIGREETAEIGFEMTGVDLQESNAGTGAQQMRQQTPRNQEDAAAMPPVDDWKKLQQQIRQQAEQRTKADRPARQNDREGPNHSQLPPLDGPQHQQQVEQAQEQQAQTEQQGPIEQLAQTEQQAMAEQARAEQQAQQEQVRPQEEAQRQQRASSEAAELQGEQTNQLPPPDQTIARQAPPMNEPSPREEKQRPQHPPTEPAPPSMELPTEAEAEAARAMAADEAERIASDEGEEDGTERRARQRQREEAAEEHPQRQEELQNDYAMDNGDELEDELRYEVMELMARTNARNENDEEKEREEAGADESNSALRNELRDALVDLMDVMHK